MLVLWALRNKERADQLRVALELAQAKAKVSGLEADKKARAIELVKNRDMARDLDAKILDAKKNVVAVVKAVDKMDDLTVAEEFRKMGYDK